jgi:hypothetical protein
MTKSEAARVLGRLGGHTQGEKLTAAHKAAISRGRLAQEREKQAKRVAAMVPGSKP